MRKRKEIGDYVIIQQEFYLKELIYRGFFDFFHTGKTAIRTLYIAKDKNLEDTWKVIYTSYDYLSELEFRKKISSFHSSGSDVILYKSNGMQLRRKDILNRITATKRNKKFTRVFEVSEEKFVNFISKYIIDTI